MEENKYYFARELIYNLRSCHAITENVFVYWLDKLNKQEKEALDRPDVNEQIEKLVCYDCNSVDDVQCYCLKCLEERR